MLLFAIRVDLLHFHRRPFPSVPSPLQYFPLPMVLPLGKIFFLSLNYI